MFQFPAFAPIQLVTHLQCAGLPHSDITGSIPVCSSPVLFAAYHVLRRLQKPRHPPFALVTFSLNEFLWITCQMFTHLSCFTRCLEIAVHNYDWLSLSLFCYRLTFLLLTLPRYLSQTCQWTSIRATVVSQMGCKDTDFFLTSKFFCKIFSKNFTFFSSPTHK